MDKPEIDPNVEEWGRVRVTFTVVVEFDAVRPKGRTLMERVTNMTPAATQYNVQTTIDRHQALEQMLSKLRGRGEHVVRWNSKTEAVLGLDT